MKAVLLFDSMCNMCSEVASDIKHIAGGKIEIRSLYDSEMSSLLHANAPNWEWKPTLIIRQNDKVEVFTGIRLWWKLIQLLGIKRAINLLRTIQRNSVRNMYEKNPDLDRRTFLKQSSAGIVSLFVVSNVPRSVQNFVLSQKNDQTIASNMSYAFEGELYEGFLILPSPEDIPNVLVEGEDFDQVLVNSLESVSEALGFIDFPLYVLKTLPPNIEFSGAYVEKYKSSSKAHACVINYLSPQKDNLVSISIIAHAEYPKPYPIRPVHKLKESYDEIELVHPARISFSPTPGLMLPSAEGYVLHWIEKDILYSLISEHTISREAAVNLAKSLELLTPT